MMKTSQQFLDLSEALCSTFSHKQDAQENQEQPQNCILSLPNCHVHQKNFIFICSFSCLIAVFVESSDSSLLFFERPPCDQQSFPMECFKLRSFENGRTLDRKKWGWWKKALYNEWQKQGKCGYISIHTSCFVRRYGSLRFNGDCDYKWHDIAYINTVDGKNLNNPPSMHKNPVKNGTNYQPQLVSRISSINRITCCTPASSKGCCLNPKGWCTGTPYHPFSTPWKIQAGINGIYIYIDYIDSLDQFV